MKTIRAAFDPSTAIHWLHKVYMIRLVLTALVLVVVGSVATAATAKDLFVNNVAGDDRRDGGSPEIMGSRGGPCRSIRRALQLAEAGDRVILARTEQPYRESITLQAGKHSGTSREAFQVVGNGAVLDGSQAVPLGAWEHVRDDVFRFRPQRMSYQLLYLGERPALRRPAEPIQGLPPLEPLEWSLYQRHIHFRTEPNKLPHHYTLAHTHLPVGITLYDVRNVVIRDLVIQGFQLDGVNAHDNVFQCKLEDLNCRGNGRSGISIGGACRVQANRCLVGDNGAAQVRTEGECTVELLDCELLENTAPALVQQGGRVVVSDAPAGS